MFTTITLSRKGQADENLALCHRADAVRLARRARLRSAAGRRGGYRSRDDRGYRRRARRRRLRTRTRQKGRGAAMDQPGVGALHRGSDLVHRRSALRDGEADDRLSDRRQRDAAQGLAQPLYSARAARDRRRRHGSLRHDLGSADVHQRGAEPRHRALLHCLVAAVHRRLSARVEIRAVRDPHRGGASHHASTAAPPRERRTAAVRGGVVTRRRARRRCAAHGPRVRFRPRRSAR